MQDPKSVLKNEMYKPLWNFYIQTVDLISARRPDLIIIHTHTHTHTQKKRTCKIVDLAVSTDHRIKLKESEKKINISTLLEN